MASLFSWYGFLLVTVISMIVPQSVIVVVDACTVFLVGKDASIDGSVLVTHSNDGEFDTDPRLVKVPAQDHPPHSLRPVYYSPESYPRYVGTSRGVPEYHPRVDLNQTDFVPIGFLPQVDHTYAYLEETYGAVNEWQVGIGESTCSGIFGAIPLGVPNGTALLSIDELTQLAMERTTSARDAIVLMGTLAVEYGFYGAGEFEGTAESLAVTDPDEAWIFHILPDPTGQSAIWVAQKIPSNAFAVLANMFVIRHVDPNDADHFLMSDSVHAVAERYGWWNRTEGTLLDFTKIYSDGEYAHKYYSGRRMWGAYHLAAPSRNYPPDYDDLQSDPVYPVHTIPDRRLGVKDLFRWHRYTYQNTPYDLGGPGNLAAGPFGSPDRWKGGVGERIVRGNWERPIGLYRTSDTYVVQSHDQFRKVHNNHNNNNEEEDDHEHSGMGAILWFGPASALGTIFTPFSVNMSDIPLSFRSGHPQVFDRTAAFWAVCIVANLANLKWSYMIQDIQALQDELESSSIDLVWQLHQQLLVLQRQQKQQPQDDPIDHNYDHEYEWVERTLVSNAEQVVLALSTLQDELLFKYASGFINELPDQMSQMPGYPAWWLQSVGYEDGPPPPPTTPKCCHPIPTGHDDDKVGRWHPNVTQLTGKAAMRQHQRTLGR